MSYTKFFDPKRREPPPDGWDDALPQPGDRTRPGLYVYDDPNDTITLSVNVALATGRPLLVSGEPGTGKTSLAEDVAQRLGWRYYPLSITSRTQGQDLLWTFDAVRRLADAQASHAGESLVQPEVAYLEPGVLWWAFDRGLAGRRGLEPDDFEELRDTGVKAAVDPQEEHPSERAVVLLDEIDKADPDVPNNLLGALGSYRFWADPVGRWVEAGSAPLVILTTNDERELPRAFLRRCVSLTLPTPDEERLVKIARRHFAAGDAEAAEADEALFRKVAQELAAVRAENRSEDRKPPSVAEYLDAVQACRQLGLGRPGSGAWVEHWQSISEATLAKKREIEKGEQEG